MTDTPWLASYPKNIDWDAPLPEKPLYDVLDHSAGRFPSRPCLRFMDRTLTYAQVAEASSRLAGGLAAMGIGKGVRVGLMMPNCPAYVIGYFAILRTGATVVNFNPLLAEAEIAQLIHDAGIRHMITVNLRICHDKILAANAPLEKLIVADFPAMLGAPKSWLMRLFRRGELSSIPRDTLHRRFEPLLLSPPLRPLPPIAPATDIALLQYTGGTTGLPKGAMLTHANVYANTLQSSLWCQADLPVGEGRMMGVLPLFHVFAMTTVMLFGLFRGMEIVLHPRFDLKALLKDLDRLRPVALPGVPTMFAAIANAPDIARYDLSSLSVCISGGAPLPLEIKNRFEQITGCRLFEGYGLTETSPVATANPLGGGKPGSIGLPLPRTHVSIRDPRRPAAVMPTGEVGELAIAGPQVMKGYWQRPEENAATLHHDGEKTWLLTGDLGFMDAEGYTTIVDRKKEMILSRGYNVYPRHVEEAIYQHASVLEAAVIGVPDEMLGQRVKAFVALKPGAALSAEELMAFLEHKIARYALPKEIEFRDSLPKSMIGKILKKELR